MPNRRAGLFPDDGIRYHFDVAGIATLEQLTSLLRGQGVRTAYVKLLSAKQDNSKNQIYLGSGLDGVTNLFPATLHARSASESVAKRGSRAGQPKLEAKIDFAWLGENGSRNGQGPVRNASFRLSDWNTRHHHRHQYLFALAGWRGHRRRSAWLMMLRAHRIAYIEFPVPQMLRRVVRPPAHPGEASVCNLVEERSRA